MCVGDETLLAVQFDDTARGRPSSTGVSEVQPSRYFAPLIEMLAFIFLLALMALPAPARAQTSL